MNSMLLQLLLGALPLLQQEEPEYLAPPPEVHVEVKPDVWFATLRGSGKLNKWFGTERDTEEKAPRFSFDREGRLDSAEPAPGGQLEIFRDKGREFRGFGIQYLQAEWSESGTVDRPFVVDTTTVPAGSPFSSRMVKRTASIYGFGGIRSADMPVEARMRVGFLFHQERFRMNTTFGDLEDSTAGFNLNVGGRLELRPVPFLFIAGEASGSIGIGVPEVQAAISGGAMWGGLQIEGGYRHLWTGWDLGPIFRMSVGGPFVGGAVRF
jgi:hypothetical protein